MYKPIKVDVPEKIHDRLKSALKGTRSFVSIKVNLLTSEGNDLLLLTRGQIAKIERARLMGKRKAISIRMSRKQVQANAKHEGGFLGLLIAAITAIASAAASAAPAILAGVATGVATGLVERAVSGGNGIYLKKAGGECARVQLVNGGGLYLSPHPAPVEGDGLFLKIGKDIYGQEVLSRSPWMKKEAPQLGLLL